MEVLREFFKGLLSPLKIKIVFNDFVFLVIWFWVNIDWEFWALSEPDFLYYHLSVPIRVSIGPFHKKDHTVA